MTGPKRPGGVIPIVFRLLAVMAVLLGVMLVSLGGAASAATPHSRGLRLVSQSPWVLSGQTFDLTVALPPGTPPDDRIQAFAYARLTTRTGFDQALSGQMNGSAQWHFYPTPVSQVPTDAAGDVLFRIPVDTSVAGSPFASLYTSSTQGPGVFPLQVRLFNSDGDPVAQPLTTFLVYGGSPGGNSTSKLSVSLTIPVHAAPALGPTLSPQRLGLQASSELAALADVLASRSDVPVSLDVTPQTLDALAVGSAADRATLDTLAGLPDSDQVLPATYVSTDLPGMVASGLDGEITTQLQAGAATLAARLHKTPSMRTWVTSGPLDELAASDLVRRGTSQLIIPNGDLSPLPSSGQQTTFARPSQVTGRSWDLVAVGADPDLSRLLTSGGDPVLVANQVLAELAMVQVETPALTRGVAVLPPANWVANPTLLNTLLSGLAGNPLVNAVTADGLFDAVPQGSDDESPIPRSLAATKPSAGVAQASSIRSARDQVSAFATVVPARSSVAAQAMTQLLVAESTDLPVPTRQTIMDRVGTTTQAVLKQIRLPGASSITVTSRNAGVPLTVLSDPSVVAHVQLRLSSTKLVFHEFTAPGGQPCVVPQPTLATCDLVLTTAVTTLRVPVEARTSGVFPLSVTLWSPDGSMQLDSNDNTVRSTAVSWVGIIIIVVAALFLGAWWIRDVRHGRRARQLIDRSAQTPPPSDGSTGDPELGPSPEGPSEPTLEPLGTRAPGRQSAADLEEPSGPGSPSSSVPAPDEGSAIEGFFATPPPPYRR